MPDFELSLSVPMYIMGYKNLSACSVDDCEIEAYEGYDKCVLHCEKGNYHADSHKDILVNFYKELINYLSEDVFKYKQQDAILNAGYVKQYFEKKLLETIQQKIIVVLKFHSF